MKSILHIDNLNKRFDGTVALDNFSLKVQAASITGIIGPNGAGKTTLFNVITGFLPPDSGSIQYNDQQLIGLPPYKIARDGIVRTFQQLRLITRLTVLDNILLAFQNQAGERLRNIFTFSRLIKIQEQANRKKTQELLDSLGIRDKENALVEDLSYGQQKMVSLLSCLAAGAKVVLLDEPVAGVNPEIINIILEMIRKLPEQGVTVILIEHNMDAIMRICDNLIFMDQGKKIVEGDPEMVRNDPAVIEAYLE
ncbi:MAG: ABC transporter ATP-binding protein [Desulfobacterales bacterium]|nr:ABC transporter ATP-binding protein [Desulfobacterales bacterium]